MYQQIYLESKKKYNEYKLKFNNFNENQENISILSSLKNENAKHCLENNILKFDFDLFIKDCTNNNNNFFNYNNPTDIHVDYLKIIENSPLLYHGGFGKIFSLSHNEKQYIIKVQEILTIKEKIRICREILINQYFL